MAFKRLWEVNTCEDVEAIGDVGIVSLPKEVGVPFNGGELSKHAILRSIGSNPREFMGS